MNRNDLQLTVVGGLKKCPRSSIIGVIEQICWLVSVAGNTQTRCLAKHVEEVKQGRPTREYSDIIYTGSPVIEAGDGTCIGVSFAEPARPFRQANQALVRTSGHCWKTMAGVTIVANGFAIPPRPRQGSGLEASLSVLRELIRRGHHGRSPFTLERPMVVFPPREVSRTDKSGQASTSYKLRYILAAEYEQPLRKRGNIVYWHFDAGKECTSEQSLDQVEAGIGVDPEAIDPDSRHFVGWSKSAGHLAGEFTSVIWVDNNRSVPRPGPTNPPAAFTSLSPPASAGATCRGCLAAGPAPVAPTARLPHTPHSIPQAQPSLLSLPYLASPHLTPPHNLPGIPARRV